MVLIVLATDQLDDVYPRLYRIHDGDLDADFILVRVGDQTRQDLRALPVVREFLFDCLREALWKATRSPAQRPG